MANVKLGNNTLSNVDTIVLQDADNVGQQVEFVNGGAETITGRFLYKGMDTPPTIAVAAPAGLLIQTLPIDFEELEITILKNSIIYTVNSGNSQWSGSHSGDVTPIPTDSWMAAKAFYVKSDFYLEAM